MAPFRFQEEEEGGTTPKVLVRDASKRLWSVKWGDEVKAEPFATRLLWAVGYLVEPSYYVAHGIITDVGALTRAGSKIDHQGNFSAARFELRDPNYRPVPNENWAVQDMPVSPQIAGLKIMMMLVSNWDLKDARSGRPDSNTSVMKRELPDGTVRKEYVINDWGGTMGRWGNLATRSKWDCKGYAAQTEKFVRRVEGDRVEFGFTAAQGRDVRSRITVADVRWLMRYLGQITDNQLRDGLAASGATRSETECFVRAVRGRIEQLRRAAEGS